MSSRRRRVLPVAWATSRAVKIAAALVLGASSVFGSNINETGLWMLMGCGGGFIAGAADIF
jgi:hypothetical protein